MYEMFDYVEVFVTLFVEYFVINIPEMTTARMTVRR
jgi:hypothetical protein